MQIRTGILVCLMVLSSWQFSKAQDSTTLPHCANVRIRTKLGLIYPPPFKSINATNDQGQYFIIPVVVHVIHNGGPENVSDNIVRSQIDVLNEDFGHYGRGDNNFPMGGDTKIRFALATIDPNGNLTTGIEHIQCANPDLYSDKEMVIKNLSHWDPKRYLNIWVVKSIDKNIPGNTEVGYAYLARDLPYLSDPNADGLVLAYKFFGRNSPYSPADYKYGRSCTHEAGHYLDLEHTWGGDGPGQGGCNDDDEIDDTPDCAYPYYSKYLGSFPDSCTDTVQCGYLRLIADYMDYSVDRCVNIFTKGQGNKMRQTILNDRFVLTTYQNAVATGIKSTYLNYNPPVEDALDINPNPANGTVYLYPKFVNAQNGALEIFDMTGRLVIRKSITNIKSDRITVAMNDFSNGLYLLVLHTDSEVYKLKLVIGK